MNNRHKTSCIKAKGQGNISPTVCCRNAAGPQCILVQRSHNAVHGRTLDVFGERATSQGDRRCNYGAITLMTLSESCCGIFESAGEQKVAATVGHNA